MWRTPGLLEQHIHVMQTTCRRCWPSPVLLPPVAPGFAAATVSVHVGQRRVSRKVHRRRRRCVPALAALSVTSCAVGCCGRDCRVRRRAAAEDATDAPATAEKRADGLPRHVLRLGAKDEGLLLRAEEQLRVRAESRGLLIDVREELLIQSSSSEGALSRGEVDVVACSFRDLARLPPGLSLAAILPRGDAREVLVVRGFRVPATGLSGLPQGAVVCASSEQRRLQIMAKHQHLVVDGHGVGFQKQLRLLHDGHYDACVVAAVDLVDWDIEISAPQLQLLDPCDIMPDFGQGIIGLVCQQNRRELVDMLAKLDDISTRRCSECEQYLMSSLELFGDAVAGGLAQLQPDGQLEIQCTVAWPGGVVPALACVRKLGSSDQSVEMAQEIVAECTAQTVHGLLTHSSTAAPGKEGAQVEHNNGADCALEETSRTGLALMDNTELTSIDSLNITGSTSCAGRVCAVFPHGGGALIDIGCEFPARWLPEHGGDDDERRSALELGSQVEVFCAQQERRQLRAFSERPPGLIQRGTGERFKLDALLPGEGPFRAVVVSCTTSDILVDFNCEVLGLLLSDRLLMRGDELRVYCVEVDTTSGRCIVCTNKERPVSRMTLQMLSTAADVVAHRGVVKRITDVGAFVDFNCEVQGLVGPLDIDIDAWPDGLAIGHEVTVYVASVDISRRQLRLSMFQPRPSQVQRPPQQP